MSEATVSETCAAKFGRCKEQACTVAANGECYEGLSDLSSCSNYIPLSDEKPEDEEDYESSDDSGSDGQHASRTSLVSIDLYRGNELNYVSSLRITLAVLARVIVLAGPNDSGKTTLLSSIFEHYFTNPLAGYLFAGSESLPAFDERCHLSRTDSQRQIEDTERTKSYSEQTMLHLVVRDADLRGPAQHLLFSDIRGELFTAALKSKAEAQRIEILKRADHLVVLVDGAKLGDLHNRNQAATAAKMMLRSFVEAEMIGKKTFVDVLFTKDDLIRKTEEKSKTSEFLKVIEEEIRQKYEHHVRRLTFHRIAARVADNVHSYGLPELFRGWVEDSAYRSQAKDRQSQRPPRAVTSQREFDRFSVKHLAKQSSKQRDRQHDSPQAVNDRDA